MFYSKEVKFKKENRILNAKCYPLSLKSLVLMHCVPYFKVYGAFASSFEIVRLFTAQILTYLVHFWDT